MVTNVGENVHIGFWGERTSFDVPTDGGTSPKANEFVRHSLVWRTHWVNEFVRLCSFAAIRAVCTHLYGVADVHNRRCRFYFAVERLGRSIRRRIRSAISRVALAAHYSSNASPRDMFQRSRLSVRGIKTASIRPPERRFSIAGRSFATAASTAPPTSRARPTVTSVRWTAANVLSLWSEAEVGVRARVYRRCSLVLATAAH